MQPNVHNIIILQHNILCLPYSESLKGRYQQHHCINITKQYFSGELAESFSVLVRVLHSGQFKCVSPGEFKRTVGKFKSQFSGYDQQDSQELLAFLMDGLQEDLNKVLLEFIIRDLC